MKQLVVLLPSYSEEFLGYLYDKAALVKKDGESARSFNRIHHFVENKKIKFDDKATNIKNYFVRMFKDENEFGNEKANRTLDGVIKDYNKLLSNSEKDKTVADSLEKKIFLLNCFDPVNYAKTIKNTYDLLIKYDGEIGNNGDVKRLNDLKINRQYYSLIGKNLKTYLKRVGNIFIDGKPALYFIDPLPKDGFYVFDLDLSEDTNIILSGVGNRHKNNDDYTIIMQSEAVNRLKKTRQSDKHLVSFEISFSEGNVLDKNYSLNKTVGEFKKSSEYLLKPSDDSNDDLSNIVDSMEESMHSLSNNNAMKQPIKASERDIEVLFDQIRYNLNEPEFRENLKSENFKYFKQVSDWLGTKIKNLKNEKQREKYESRLNKIKETYGI